MAGGGQSWGHVCRERSPLQRTVHILLECVLVYYCQKVIANWPTILNVSRDKYSIVNIFERHFNCFELYKDD